MDPESLPSKVPFIEPLWVIVAVKLPDAGEVSVPLPQLPLQPPDTAPANAATPGPPLGGLPIVMGGMLEQAPVTV
jgi:hypothetical protein